MQAHAPPAVMNHSGPLFFLTRSPLAGRASHVQLSLGSAKAYCLNDVRSVYNLYGSYF